jgi:hypothetical protein
MIQKIKNHNILSPFTEDTCCENGICVSFDENLEPNNYVIIKVDNYYNSLNLAATPPSVDCLIIRRCINGGYGLTIVELKDIGTGAAFTIDNMKGKFNTTLNNFIKRRFKELLNIEYNEIKLYFVSNIDIYKRDLGLKMEVLINTQFDFNGKKLMIQPKMPTPTIKNCYN